MAFIHPDAPSFHHPEIKVLYEKGLHIEAAELQTILNLPRPALVQDLEAILADSREHFSYYEKLWDEEPEDEFQDAPLNAIMLLGELQSKASMPAILEWLSGPEAFLDFWVGDHLTETIWEAVYKLLPADWELLEVFLKKPDVNLFARTVVTQALNQLVLRQPEYYAAVVSLYERVLTYYQLHQSEDKDDFLSMLAGEAIELQAKELIPLLTMLHDTIPLDEMIAGSKEEIVSDMEREPVIREMLPIAERYQEIVTNWAGYTETDDELEDDESANEADADWKPWDDEEEDKPELLPVRTEPKIGRNDPCPCGSGKKYKKCHLNA